MARDRTKELHDFCNIQLKEIITVPSDSTLTDSQEVSSCSSFHILKEAELIESDFENIIEDLKILENLHSNILNEINRDKIPDIQTRIDIQVSNLISQLERSKNHIKNFSSASGNKFLFSEAELEIRSLQAKRLEKEIFKLVKNFYDLQKIFKIDKKKQIERQFKIIRPDATPEEVERILDPNIGDVKGFFKQEMLQSSLKGKKEQLRVCQERHSELQKIEKTISELLLVFNDLGSMLKEQDTKIEAIERTVEVATETLEVANVEIVKATKYVKSYRKKARIFCVITFFLVLIAGLATYFLLVKPALVNPISEVVRGLPT
ncbi:hypothetical protein HK099_002134 [Clydaea vesicula]|uniref:t-SNARE coiled-coil homology domain-containing protein n=1 Tax=Clydaea vesicula TaxID=447962 RepID=A0AAD5XWV0_9FUNG|nr:hypothetical protein HK099_002134 [Clydaea vesicula]